MSQRIRRVVAAAVVCAASSVVVTIGETDVASAATFSVSIATGGTIGNMGVDALYNGGGGGDYDTYSRWNGDGSLQRMVLSAAGYYVDAQGSPFALNGSPTTIRLELYPKPTQDYNIPYDPWLGNVGGANVQRDRSRDGSNWLNFGEVPLPIAGQDGAFRIEGAIVSSTPVADGRVHLDIFQIPCGWPDTCIDTRTTSTGAAVGAFASGASKGKRWTGSVGWAGRYVVYAKDTATGRSVHGSMDISEGHVPAIDLDAPCFGMRTCVYDQGSAPTPQGGFHPVSPTRVLDTRIGLGISNGSVRPGDGRLDDPNPEHRHAETDNHDLKVTGVAGIPESGVAAVLLNVTAVAPPSIGFVSVYPRPAAVGDFFNDQATYNGYPSTSNLNLSTGETVPNVVLARVGAGGMIRLYYAGLGDMNIIADVAGWFDTGAPEVARGGLGYTSVAPTRLLDTRNGIGDKAGRYQIGDDRSLKVAGVAGVPADAQSVVLNVTSAAPTGVGYVTVYPDGQARPNASNLNVNPGQTRPNLVVVKVGAAGKIRLAALETDTDLIVDVFGYYGVGGGVTTAIDPVRVVDTRAGLGSEKRAFGPGETRQVRVAGVGGVPANARSVMLNVAAVDPSSWGWLTVWPSNLKRPDASNLNWPGGGNVPNMVMVGVGPDGTVSIYNDLGTTQVLVDVFGYTT
ncbi:MAG: hypothetical protein WCC60_20170 [Ilumatobacteraceae bacterium]